VNTLGVEPSDSAPLSTCPTATLPHGLVGSYDWGPDGASLSSSLVPHRGRGGSPPPDAWAGRFIRRAPNWGVICSVGQAAIPSISRIGVPSGSYTNSPDQKA
jgi:hypothetical protein